MDVERAKEFEHLYWSFGFFMFRLLRGISFAPAAVYCLCGMFTKDRDFIDLGMGGMAVAIFCQLVLMNYWRADER